MIGKRISNLLQENDMTQKELASKIGVTEVTISRYVTGERTPQTDIIVKIADALHSTTDYLLGRTEVQNQPETSAAHRVSDPMSDLPPEALDELEKLKQYVLSKYRKDKPSDGK